MIDEANEKMKTFSKGLEIRPSEIGSTRTKGKDDACYEMFATKNIESGERILIATHPFGVSLEQGITQCYNLFKQLASDNPASIVASSCCPNVKYCGSRCEQIAAYYYHKIRCCKNFSSLYGRKQTPWGGKDEKPILGPWAPGATRSRKAVPKIPSYHSHFRP